MAMLDKRDIVSIAIEFECPSCNAVVTDDTVEPFDFSARMGRGFLADTISEMEVDVRCYTCDKGHTISIFDRS